MSLLTAIGEADEYDDVLVQAEADGVAEAMLDGLLDEQARLNAMRSAVAAGRRRSHVIEWDFEFQQWS